MSTYNDTLDVAEAAAERYRAVHGRAPSPRDIAHNIWRFLREGWSRADILKDIGPEPTKPDPVPPTPEPPPGPAHERDPKWQAMVRDTITGAFTWLAKRQPTDAEMTHAFEMAHQPPRGKAWTHIEIQDYAREQGKNAPAPTPPIPSPTPETGRVRVDDKVFRDAHGRIFQWRGATMFLLFRRFLNGENIGNSLEWMRRQRVNVARVIGMVAWDGFAFGPSDTLLYYTKLREFATELGAHGFKLEFVAFADAQIVMPSLNNQHEHLRRVFDAIGHLDNVFIEVCNEPFKNGVDPSSVLRDQPRPACPVALGDYVIEPVFVDGEWRGQLARADYVTMHTPRDADSWARKAKDLLELRDGAGTGEPQSPRFDGVRCPVVDDEPMGAAEADRVNGRQRSANPSEHFWHHAVAAMFSAGSTIHFDEGLYGFPAPPNSDQQKCADAITLAWSLVDPESQAWHYTRGGLADCPLVFDAHLFPEQTSRIYAKIGGNRAVAVAVHPATGWRPVAANGWRIVSAAGPQDSLVVLER
jgi:hypothetical protein